MSRFNKIFSREFPFHLIKFYHSKASAYLQKKHQHELDLIELEWEEKFAQKDSFVFQLDTCTKINLYKDSILSRHIYNGFEKEELKFVKSYLIEGDIFVDAGANIGLFTLPASSRVGNQGMVISYEPAPKTYERLVENIKLNNLKNIIPRNIGLSEKAGRLNLQLSNNGYDAWNTFADAKDDMFHEKANVEVCRLDDELKIYDQDKISLIKIDVEGWEKFLLKGSLYLLQNYSPVLMIEFTEVNTFAAGYFVHEIYDLLLKYGYKWYRYRGNEMVPEAKRLYYPYDNLIACKDLSQVNKRLKINPYDS